MLRNLGISFGWEIPGVIWVSGIVLALVAFWAIREKSWQLGLVALGGGLNWWQRITLGYVVDYWKLPLVPIYNNINDWLVVLGLVLYLWKKLK